MEKWLLTTGFLVLEDPRVSFCLPMAFFRYSVSSSKGETLRQRLAWAFVVCAASYLNRV